MKLALVTVPAAPAKGVDPERRGYAVAYRRDQVNHCPGCGRSNWHVGRSSAECGFCATAIPFAEAGNGRCTTPVIPLQRKGS